MLLRVVTKIIFAVVLCMFIVMPQAHAASKDLKIGLFVFRYDDLYINLVAKAVQKNLAGKAELSVFDAKQSQSTQANQISQFVANGASALLVNLVDVKFGQNILNIAKNANIPIIFFNKQPDFNILKECPLAVYVGSEANQSGVLQGDIVADLWHNNPQFDRNNDGICNFFVIQGNIDNPEALARSRQSVLQARRMGVNMQQLGDTIICDWDEDCAYAATKAAFGLHGDEVDFIISNNDGMALGAIKSLQDYGFNLEGGDKFIPVVGIDGIGRAKDAISKGTMHGTIIQDADAMAMSISAIALNALNNKSFFDGLPYVINEDKISISIPYKAYQPE